MNNGSTIFCDPVEKITGDSLVSGNGHKDHFPPRVIFKCPFGKRTKASFTRSVQFDHRLQKRRVQANLVDSELASIRVRIGRRQH
jgi:hypothetical protein